MAQSIAGLAAPAALPEAVAARCKDIMINAAAAGLAGSSQPEAAAITRFARETGGDGRCTIIGMGLRSSAANACLANGLMVRLLDFDDEVTGRNCHATATVFPAVMAVAEAERCSGGQALWAFALGCEITSKLAKLMSTQRADVSTILHWDPVAGAVGAAAAAAVILGLADEDLEAALDIAGEAAGPVRDAPAGPLSYGRAAARGVTGALMARTGVTVGGPAGDGMDTPSWLPGGISKGQQEEFFESLGNPWDVVAPGTALRLYPCPLAAHSPIDALIQLLQQHRTDASQARQITVSVTPETLESLAFEDPATPWEAQHSLKYLAAVTLLKGQPLLEQFHAEAIADPEVRAVMERVRVFGGETSTNLSPFPASVTVEVEDGRRLQQQVDFARGGPELPLDLEELEAKFLYCARHVMTPDHIQGTIEQFRDIENIPDVSGLSSILGA